MSNDAATQASPKRPGPGARPSLPSPYGLRRSSSSGADTSSRWERIPIPLLAAAIAAISVAPPLVWVIAAARWTAEPGLRTFAATHGVAWALIAVRALDLWRGRRARSRRADRSDPLFLRDRDIRNHPAASARVGVRVEAMWRGAAPGAKWREHIATAGLASYQWLVSYVPWMIGHS